MSINVDDVWRELCTYPEVGDKQKEELKVYHTIHYSAATRFGSIKEFISEVSEETLTQCIEELNTMPTLDGGGYDDVEEEISFEGRFHLHGNMFHELHRLDSFYIHTWDATPKKSRKKRSFF
ncbi:hypothetical protein QTG56_23700 (plasmid) [Rossellomorea sp. AcN35-11]|nr:hypothetical protein [Rossellomorea aquimaris]WJV32367.1 hypothetical protein QTG56_23700 [Rossellomorea sp. AcN35-11]